MSAAPLCSSPPGLADGYRGARLRSLAFATCADRFALGPCVAMARSKRSIGAFAGIGVKQEIESRADVPLERFALQDQRLDPDLAAVIGLARTATSPARMRARSQVEDAAW